ncbi:MAG: hypothetical protein IPM06_17025 [Rhizobiales bacterium]|nr:hypothetical protein [Hyphomicrobiales bacterium]
MPDLVQPEIAARAAPLGSDTIADPNLPAPAEAEQVDRAVKGVHALFREQGMPLTTTEESLATPPLTRREVALARVEQRAPREAVKNEAAAQMAAVEENAMAVIEPLAATMAATKTKTPKGQAKVAAKFAKAMRGVVQEAAKQGSIEAAQQYVTKNLPAALKGLGVTADAVDMAKAVNAGVGLARTQFSKGATEDYAANLAFYLQEKTGSVLGKWRGKMSASEQRKLFGRFIGKGDIIIDGQMETVANRVRVAFGQDYDDRNVTSWRDLNLPTQAPSESRAALTQDEFEALSPAAKTAALDAYTQAMRAKGTALLARLLGLIGDRPELTVSTFAAAPGGHIGSYTRVGPLKAVISMATNAKEGLSVADHEGYHFAEDWLLTGGEKKVVANALRDGKPLFEQLKQRLQQYDRENGTRLTDEVTGVPAEARAYAFEFWRRGEFKADGALARAWQKIKQFFERVANAVNGLGFQSIEDVFAALASGQMAEREMVAPEGRAAYESRAADYLQSPEFRRWFGDSKVVDAEGKPLVVYHSGMFDEADDGVPRINGEGFHFGTKAAAEMRDSGKRVDDFIKAAVIEKGEDMQGNPAWFWSSGGLDSFDLINEDGYSTEAEAEQHMKLMATQYAEDADSEPMPVTQAYLSLQNPKRVKDQGEDWTAAVAKAKAQGYDGIVYRNEFEDKGKDSYIVFSPTQIKSVNNVGTFDPNNPDIRFSAAGVAPSLSRREYSVATKPDSIKKLIDDFKGGELFAKTPLSIVQASMLPMLKHDQISVVVVKALPINVVNILTDHKLTPEQVVSDPRMVSEALPADLRASVASGFGNALMEIRTQLGTALDAVLSTGRDNEILPALRARDLSAQEVVRLLPPLRDADLGADIGGVSRASPATKSAMPAGDVTGVSNEFSIADLALALDRHKALREGYPTNYNKNDAGTQALFSRAAVEMRNRMAGGELEAVQIGEQYARLVENAKAPSDLLTRLLGVAKDDIVGGIGRWWTNNVSTPNFISASSRGFKNVYQAFNTYSRYRKILGEQLVRERVPDWYRASDADRKAAFDVMLTRTLEKYSTSSQELADLLNTLTPAQRKLYDQATGMIAAVLRRQFDSQKETRRRQLGAEAYEKWLASRQEQMTALLDQGYVPLRRYGDYSVEVYMEAPDGKRVKAGLGFFNSPSQAKTAALAYAKEIERSGVALKVEMGRRSRTNAIPASRLSSSWARCAGRASTSRRPNASAWSSP